MRNKKNKTSSLSPKHKMFLELLENRIKEIHGEKKVEDVRKDVGYPKCDEGDYYFALLKFLK